MSGGVAHDYLFTSKMLADILSKVDIESEITEDLGILEEDRLQQFQVMTLNCVKWSCSQTPEWSDQSCEISPGQQAGLLKFLASGKGLVAIHAASINFDTWPEYGQILGGQWTWGRSSHGPYGLYKMHVENTHHPITQHVSDFEIYDELYHTLSITGDVDVLVTTVWEERVQPIVWTNTYGPSRIHYNALGHSPESFECKPFQKLLCQGILWASKGIWEK
jgi:hypothetical protein